MALFTRTVGAFYGLRNKLVVPKYVPAHTYLERNPPEIDDATVRFPLMPQGVPVDYSGIPVRESQLSWQLRLPLNAESKLFTHSHVWASDHPGEEAQIALWENALHNTLFTLLTVDTSHTLQADFSEMKFPTKRGRLPLACRVLLSDGGTEEHIKKLKIDAVEYEGKRFKCGDKGFAKALDVATCAAVTQITVRNHFVWAHMLVSGTLWCLLVQDLNADHPLFQLLYPHFFATSQVNVGKGVSLMDAFQHDMSFSGAKSVKRYLQQCVNDFSLEACSHASFERRLGIFAKHSSMMEQSGHAWRTCEKYFSRCFGEFESGCSSSQKRDTELLFQHIQELPHKLACSSLLQTCVHALYMGVFLHDIYGDMLKPLVDASRVWVPAEDDPELERQSRVSKSVFQFVFFEATVKTYELQRREWVELLPRGFQHHARAFQRAALDINPHFELGINK